MSRTIDRMPHYKKRVVDSELDALLPHLPALSLEGPKGVGKTATASERGRTFRHLDDQQLSDNIERFLVTAIDSIINKQ